MFDLFVHFHFLVAYMCQYLFVRTCRSGFLCGRISGGRSWKALAVGNPHPHSTQRRQAGPSVLHTTACLYGYIPTAAVLGECSSMVARMQKQVCTWCCRLSQLPMHARTRRPQNSRRCLVAPSPNQVRLSATRRCVPLHLGESASSEALFFLSQVCIP
jgi:hypothetical protein